MAINIELKYQDIKNRCAIFNTEKTIFGIGDLTADIMLIGEAPGESEVKLGKPFVGTAGKNLDEFLDIVELNRDDMYITNTVKMRPTKISKYGNIVNRTPNKEEVNRFLRYLFEEIDLVQPKLIVTLGGVAYKAVFQNSKLSIKKNHGKKTKTMIDNVSYNVFPLYHPASVIYDKELRPDYINDLYKLKEYIQREVH